MDEKPDKPNSMLTHQPLPYLVRLREAIGGNDDLAPTIREERVVAYSLMEALLQATFQAGGTGVDDSRYRVEFIGPDLEAYGVLFADSFALALARRKG